MPPEPPGTGFDRSRVILRSLMLQLAAQSENRFSARTVIALQGQGLMTKAKPTPMSPELVDLLRNPDDSSRIVAPAGPYVFVNRDSTSRLVLDMAEYLVSTNAEVRRAALHHYRALAAGGELTPKTSAILSNAEELLVASEPKWRQAGILAYDAVQGDYLCLVAGLRQSLEMHFEAGIENLLPRALRPSQEMVQALMSDTMPLIRQREDVARLVQDLADSGNQLTAIADSYFQRFGHVPLHGSLSMAAALEPTLRRSADLEGAWDALWQWANHVGGPLPRYHLCHAYCINPALVPARRVGELWNEVAAVVGATTDNDPGPWSEAWQVRCDLARHFTHYLSCALPNYDGDALTQASLWLAERVSASFGTAPEFLNAVRSGPIASELELSRFSWQLAHPPCPPSRLRYATAFMRSAWSLSLQCQLAPLVRSRGTGVVAPPAHAKVTSALHGSVLTMFPWTAENQDAAIYGFDTGVLATAEAWLECGGSGLAADVLESLVKVTRELRSEGDLARRLVKAAESAEAEQVLVAGAVRAWVYLHQGDFDGLWETVSSSEWGDRVLSALSPNALELVFDALTEACSRGGEKWNSSLPHLFAYQLDRASAQSDRDALMVAFTVFSSLSTGGLSGIDRIAKSSRRTEYDEMLDKLRTKLTEIQPFVPPGIAGRIGAALVAIQRGQKAPGLKPAARKEGMEEHVHREDEKASG